MSKVTHIEEDDISSPKLLASSDICNDGIGSVEEWDFSRGNMSEESRIYSISLIASVCYGNPKAVGSISLYNRLACESIGLPSSSFEFVPVLLKARVVLDGTLIHPYTSACIKYGEWVENHEYVLTNLRALMADVGDKASEFFNTEEECKIIAKHFKVFKSKIPIFVARQYMRHRVSWQELSRRYVSGKKHPLEFYVSPKLDNIGATDDFEIEDINELCIKYYNKAIAQGAKPQDARMVLPVGLYTEIWSAWQPRQLEVFFKLRLDDTAQPEIRQLAKAKKGMV